MLWCLMPSQYLKCGGTAGCSAEGSIVRLHMQGKSQNFIPHVFGEAITGERASLYTADSLPTAMMPNSRPVRPVRMSAEASLPVQYMCPAILSPASGVSACQLAGEDLQIWVPWGLCAEGDYLYVAAATSYEVSQLVPVPLCAACVQRVELKRRSAACMVGCGAYACST